MPSLHWFVCVTNDFGLGCFDKKCPANGHFCRGLLRQLSLQGAITIPQLSRSQALLFKRHMDGGSLVGAFED